MSDIINIKDFYDHETRISIVENAIISIDKRFSELNSNINKRFEYIEKRMDYQDKRIEYIISSHDSHFRWIMGAFGGLALGGIGILITLIFRLH